MGYRESEVYTQLRARLADCIGKSLRGALSCTGFLTPGEGRMCREIAAEMKIPNRLVLFGGYNGAERVRAFVLPDYLDGFDGDVQSKLEEYYSDELTELVCAVKITGSGYRELAHRDFMGAVLNLGIERDAVGDIVPQNGHCAVLFCTGVVCELICSDLLRVASDKVDTQKTIIDEKFRCERKFEPINDTVASNRFDCIVGALTNLSRERAQEYVKSGLCELDFLPCDKCDRQIDPGAIISIRGYGKYIVRTVGGQTKKGRLRMSADKYV